MLNCSIASSLPARTVAYTIAKTHFICLFHTSFRVETAAAVASVTSRQINRLACKEEGEGENCFLLS